MFEVLFSKASFLAFVENCVHYCCPKFINGDEQFPEIQKASRKRSKYPDEMCIDSQISLDLATKIVGFSEHCFGKVIYKN